MGRNGSRSDSSSSNEHSLENKLVPWNPLKNLPSVLYCEAVHDDYEGFRILLKGEGSTHGVIRILFEGLVAYRNINESYRLRSLPPDGSGSLFRVESSSWIRWLCEESGGVLLAEKLTHYAVFTPEDFLDVIVQQDPLAEWLNDPIHA